MLTDIKIQEFADKFSNEILTECFKERFTSLDNLEDDAQLNAAWEALNDRFYSTIEEFKEHYAPMSREEKHKLLSELTKALCTKNGVYCLLKDDNTPRKMKGVFIEDEDNIIISLENEKDLSNPLEVYISEILTYSNDKETLITA